ncbi:MAG: SH3 domain-containing protein, partial [Anaerolineae bacterium]|nr:SH3 domain-containing protein [Anaerolineae bacterium]
MEWIRLWGTRGSVVVLILGLLLPGFTVHQVAYGQNEVQATVIPVELNVRENPSFEAATLGTYARGDVLRITGWDGTVWVFAIPLSGDLTGWVHWDYVDFPDGFSVSTLPIISATGSAGTGAGNDTSGNAA